jgi:large subunit ribosomal protein L15
MSMIHEITAKAPRNKRPLRKGRGKAQGQGKTAGRGGKGGTARGGQPHWKPGHEGGQTPIHRRMPKRGFSNDPFARDFHVVNLKDLARFDDGTTVDPATLHEAGLIPNLKLPVKILGDGEFSKKLTVVAGWYSKSAYEKITAAGGTAQNARGEAFVFPKPKKKFVPREDAKKGGKKQAAAEAEAAPAAAAAPAGEAPKAE